MSDITIRTIKFLFFFLSFVSLYHLYRVFCRSTLRFYHLVILCLCAAPLLQAEEHSFVVVIPSYNNEGVCTHNLASVFAQTYPHYRVIYIDDCSTDETYLRIQGCIAEHQQAEKVTLIRNERRLGAMENIYRAVHSCLDHEIIVMLDGDDWFSQGGALERLNDYYSISGVWMTHGSYVYHPTYHHGECSIPIPREVVEQNSIRQFVHRGWPLSHVKTFFAALFKRINQEDLMWDGAFLDSTSDQAMMLPMFEMAAHHAVFVPEVLYVNNRDNPLNDDKVNKPRQHACMLHVWELPPYQPLEELFP